MSEMEPLVAQRAEKRSFLRQQGDDPYANDFKVDTLAAEFMNCYGAESDNEVLQKIDKKHAIAGRVMAINRFGKAAFLRVQDGSADQPKDDGESSAWLQIYVKRDVVGERTYDEVFKRALDIGDIIGAVGTPMRTKTGELTLKVEEFRILTKTLRPLPEEWHGLSDVETRYRQRYLDLITNPSVRRNFKIRSEMVAFLRYFMSERSFLEVETPMLHPVAGGAAARPFKTHHNSLDVDLYMRIAPELYLKRLVVGGFDRVYEINRCFRNEGISSFHNPEFTTLESYQAYATYRDVMKMVEDMISGAAQAVLNTTQVQFLGHDISLAPPFARMSMLEAIEQHGGPSQDLSLDPHKAREALTQAGCDVEKLDHGQCILALFEHFAESKLIQPTIVYDYPVSVSPLSRIKSDDPFFVERFELFLGGHELVNAFSELNDPIDQRERFEKQMQLREAGDSEAHEMDESFLRAIEHGLPPTAGFGLGIDRLAMVLSGVSTIRDVILFPQLRPIATEG